MPELSADRVVVVAGNGSSLPDVTPGQIRADDFIIRVNNFFFEPRTWLGPRVDLFVAGGDPRVAPFLLETLKACWSDYRIGAWTTFNSRIARAGQKILPLPQSDFPVFSDVEFSKQAQRILNRYPVTPMTGTYALLIAYAAGARHFVLAGLDFYSGPQRYMYHPGPHQQALIGADLAQRGLDRHLHDAQLDLELIELVARQKDVRIWQANCLGHLADCLDPAPIRPGTPISVLSRTPPKDWAARSGLYPIHLLRLLRRLRTGQKRVAKLLRPAP